MRTKIKLETGQYARDPETYRSRRRNRAKLGVKDRDWFGVEAKMIKDKYPPLMLTSSFRGELHYDRLSRLSAKN